MTALDLGDVIMIVITVSALATMALALYWQRGQARFERRDANAYITMERALTSQQRRLEQQAARIDELERMRMSDHQLILELRQRVAALEQQLRDNGITPLPDTRTQTTAAATVDKRALAQRIAALFDMDEMATLMFDIGIDDEALAGRTRAARARELVDYAERHGQLDVLAAAVNASRPDIKS